VIARYNNIQKGATMDRESQDKFKVMRSRIKNSTYSQLVHIAKVESNRTGRQIYVADLVREACKKYIKEHLAIKQTLDGMEDN